jgi:hypothetical protein
MVPDLAVSAAPEIVGGFWKPHSAIYAAFRVQSVAAGRQGPAIALADSAEIVQDVVACGAREEGRFGVAVALIAVGTAQPIRRCYLHTVPPLAPSAEPMAVALVCIP